jgi:hypothetical protein
MPDTADPFLIPCHLSRKNKNRPRKGRFHYWLPVIQVTKIRMKAQRFPSCLSESLLADWHPPVFFVASQEVTYCHVLDFSRYRTWQSLDSSDWVPFCLSSCCRTATHKNKTRPVLGSVSPPSPRCRGEHIYTAVRRSCSQHAPLRSTRQ